MTKALKMRIRRKGYAVVKRALTTQEISDVLFTINEGFEDTWAHLFSDEDHFDPNRLQMPLNDALCDRLSKILSKHWKGLYPRSTANDWHVLKSTIGGRKQSPHTDYTFLSDCQLTAQEDLPAGMIVSLQDDTRLLSYGWNKIAADREDEEIIVLQAGDIILFRGDLIHAGDAYQTTNIRIHAYLDVDGVPRQRNQTHFVDVIEDSSNDEGSCEGEKMCFLNNCNYSADLKNMQKHMNRVHGLIMNKATNTR
jgi:hypothetical protein